MLTTANRHVESLPIGHPCQGCEVREKAVCRALDRPTLAAFKNMGRTLKLESGETLFHEGDPATRVFTLTRGTIRLYKLLADGRRQITGFMHPGDFLGISVEDEHAFSAEAIDDTQLCCFERHRFDDFAKAHGAMEHLLYRTAAHELAAAQQQLVLLGRKTATERMASFLLLLVRRVEEASGRPAELVRLAMSRSDIADYLGLTKETVSRVISALKGIQVIRLKSLDLVQILDRHELERLSESGA